VATEKLGMVVILVFTSTLRDSEEEGDCDSKGREGVNYFKGVIIYGNHFLGLRLAQTHGMGQQIHQLCKWALVCR